MKRDEIAICKSIIEQELHIAREIQEIKPMKEGMTNDSFLVKLRQSSLVVRLNGKASEYLVNRQNEQENYRALQGYNISDEVLAISVPAGYKITKYIPGSRNCRKDYWPDVDRAIKYLRMFHNMPFTVPHKFDLWQQLRHYESLAGAEKINSREYCQIKSHLKQLLDIVSSLSPQYGFAHIDSVPDNFLFTEERTYLIDWEYAGMCDQHLDIAMFGIYAGYNQAEMDGLIELYFGKVPPLDIRRKIYIYVAAGGLLWSNWCDIKRHEGIIMGDYATRQYEYAKHYVKLAYNMCI